MHWRRCGWTGLVVVSGLTVWANVAQAAEAVPILTDAGLNVRGLLAAGGAIGYLIIALSVAMVALIVEHLLSIRRSALMPPGIADQCRQLISAGQLTQAEQLCSEQPSFLGFIVSAGLQDASFGYESVEKSTEDAAQEQAARLFRKIEYLSVIGTIAPMLGLMGTVWGMIQAFGEFARQANPQVAEFAPGISHALVTTLMGLCVAIPALAAFAIFRNRIDEYVAETALLAEHVLQPLKQSLKSRSRPASAARTAEAALRSSEPPARTPPPPVARERDQLR
ncbi:MAG: MotA/TolQ/ExbB proton channel family protein [Planctomycetaceae bacterium]